MTVALNRRRLAEQCSTTVGAEVERRAAGAGRQAVARRVPGRTAAGRGLQHAGRLAYSGGEPAAAQSAEYLDLEVPPICFAHGRLLSGGSHGLLGDEELIDACIAPGGAKAVLRQVRAAEADDPDCKKYPRFKPADDATAVMLRMNP
jgi:hypothetical protein